MAEFRKFPFVDSHFHTGVFAGIGAVERIMDACGVSKLANLSLTVPHDCPGMAGEENYHPHYVNKMKVNLLQNPITMLLKALHPGRIYGFGGLYHDLPGKKRSMIDLRQQAETLMDMGFDGMKMIEGHVWARKNLGKKLDDPSYLGFFAFMEQNSLPITYHLGSPYYFVSDTFREEAYCQISNIMDLFPRLKIIFAHFFFMDDDIDRAATYLEKWENIAYDVTPHWVMYENFSKNYKTWRSFFKQYSNRILFGTDISAGRYPIPDAPDISRDVVHAKASYLLLRTALESDRYSMQDGKELMGLKLDEESLRNILYMNYERYAGTIPHGLVIPLALAECEKVLFIAEKSTDGDFVIPDLREIMRRLDSLQ